MNFEDCLKKGLLKKDVVDSRRASKSLLIAEHKLSLANKLFKLAVHEEVITASYASMFHAARAILFHDGYVEKSHFALFVYLRDNYSGKIESRFITELNNLRLERHDINYGLEKPVVDPDDCKAILGVAKDFINAVRGLLR